MLVEAIVASYWATEKMGGRFTWFVRHNRTGY
jgi:hypothetical protein